MLGVDAIWWSFPISSLASVLMILAYYRWGNWRAARMLPRSAAASVSTADDDTVNANALLEQADDCERVAMPAEVGGQPPSPVATQAQPAQTSPS